MRDSRLIVLKFGGSVLRSRDDLPNLVHEIYRWTRRGLKVVAVVSAYSGQTDRLLAEAAEDGDPLPTAAAMLASTGELQSAAHLALAAHRAGLAAELLDTAAIRLRTRGDALDSDPIDVSTDRIRRELRSADVLVIPGFIGRDARGRVTLLGRGGSDLTALSLAYFLSARCRLVKDVDGLYQWDPRLPGPAPRRFASLAWNDALQLDGSIVQHKAVAAAAERGQAFEVGSLLRDDPTRVGPLAVEFSEPFHRPRPLRVALLGAGAVGRGVLPLVQRLPGLFQPVAIAVRDPARHADLPSDLLCSDVARALGGDADCVVDMTGDVAAGRRAATGTLRAGRAFITANKRLVAEHGAELAAEAHAFGGTFSYSAAVGGAAPLLEAVARAARREAVTQFCGILNGTANFVFDLASRGTPLDDALQRARRAGFAESDASRDLDGRDAADKLVLLIHAASGRWIDPSAVARDPVPTPAAGRRWCQLGRFRIGRGAIHVQVAWRPVRTGTLWYGCRGNWNVARLRTESGQETAIWGKGAGRWPTAQSLLADLLDVASGSVRTGPSPVRSLAEATSAAEVEVLQ